jgi:DNA polymerase-3 subunit delta'
LSSEPLPIAPVLDRIVGQPRALRILRASVRAPVHAYLFVGPPGSGKREAAMAFAAALCCPNGGCGQCTACKEALAGRHPDVVTVERSGASISAPQAREVVRLALLSPRAAPYQVLVLVDFHLVEQAGPVLLKTIEEPPDTTVVIVLADYVPSELVTIASRCLSVEFDPLAESDIVTVLSREDVGLPAAEAVAQVARGRLDRARLLARDEGFSVRMERWRQIPGRLDGTGATVALLAHELVEAASEPVEVVKTVHAEELSRLTELAKQSGERTIPGRPAIEDRHRREERRARIDDLRAGLATLAATYRLRLDDVDAAPAPGGEPRPAGPALSTIAVPLRAVELVNEAAERLTRNPNEALLLEWLLLRLDGLS